MKYRCLTALLFLVATMAISSISAQEICNNGIDDDNDGLIDLNDVAECSCSGIFLESEITTAIPNPSFENFDCGPGGEDAVDCISDWVNASEATPDYFHTEGYLFESLNLLGLIPFPEGEAVIGGLLFPGFLEYVGTCLEEPLLAGIDYELNFEIAAFPVDGAGQPCDMGNDSYGIIDLVLYGNTDCSNLPWTGTACPISGGTGWEVIGTVTYDPVDSWNEITISFTPDEDIQAITVGPPCTLPPSYINAACIPYFVYDAFSLNSLQFFTEVPLESSGNTCEDNIVLGTINLPDDVTIQWYQDGVALVGQTASTLDVSGNGLDVGTYQLVVSQDGECTIGEILVEASFVTADFSTEGFCTEQEIAFTNESTSGIDYTSEWDFGDGSPVVQGENPSHSYDDPGTYEVELTITAGNCEDSETVDVEISPAPDIDLSSDPVCEGEDLVIFSDSDTENLEFSWTGPNNFSSAAEDVVIPDATVDDNGTYAVTVTDELGCTNSAEVDAVIYQSTETEVESSICDGESYTLPDGTTVTDAGEYTSVLVSPTTGCDSSIVTELSVLPAYFNEFDATICTGQTYTLPDGDEVTEEGEYTIMLTAISGCDSITQVDLTVLPFPELTLDIGDPFCPGTGVVPVFPSPSGGTLSGIHVSDGDLDLTGVPPGNYSVYYAYAINNGCSDTIEVSYNILTTLTPEFEYDITCNTVEFVSVTPDPQGSFEYEWTLEGAAFGVGQSTDLTISQPLNNDVFLTIVDDNDCVSTAAQLVQVAPQVDFSNFFVPNVITPNGDGLNDFLELSVDDPECLDYNITILDRWGNKVFESAQNNEPFVGRSITGNELSEGVYFYIFESPQIDCNDPIFGNVCQGSITIIR